MASTNVGLRSSFLSFLGALAVMAALLWPAHAGEGAVLHVGETTELVLDGGGWEFDKAASRKAHLVSVQKANGVGASQRFVVRGLKTGQVELVFRSGQKTFRAYIDVLN